MTKVYVFPWHPASKGASALAQTMGIPRIVHGPNSKYQGNPTKVVINWGSSDIKNAEVTKSTIINRPENVRKASNKLDFFIACSEATDGPRIPDWTDDAETAVKWFKEGKEVIARLILNGHSGVGINFFSEHKDDLTSILQAKLFVKYVKKRDEYRVHIVDDKIIHVQQKKARTRDDVGQEVDTKLLDYRVRNVANGFIFAIENVDPPQDVLDQAKKAVRALGLDFGAVDVIWNEAQKQAYVLEVNTAPGLEGTTPKKYAEALTSYIEELKL